MFKLAWSKNGTPDTLTSSGSSMTISDLTAYKFNQGLYHVLPTGGTISNWLRADSNSNTDYADRVSGNGGADGTNTSSDDIQQIYSTAEDDMFEVFYSCNIDSEEKLFIGFLVQNNGAGATNAPDRQEQVNKIDTTTNTGQYTAIEIRELGTGSYNTDSNFSMLGTD